jgi:branched-chain amino acid transport system permease protein
MNYFLHLLVFLEIYVIVALSLNLLIGYSGLLQIAHAAYYGVGAYAGSLLMLKIGFGFISAMIFGGLVSALLSLLVSLPAWRFRGDYFVMISLAVQVALYSVMYNWVELTNGPYGLTGIPQPAIFDSIFATTGSIALFYGVIVAIIAGILGILKLSPFGRSLQR